MDRIDLLASFTKGSECVCDIGCDHAYTLVYAIKKYGVKSGLAVDVAKGPLANAKKTISLNHLDDKIKLILSDGFEKLQNESFDTAILSGMGGILIKEILQKGLPLISSKKLILGAHNDVYILRKFLQENHFKIIKEEAIYDQSIYYEIIVATAGKMNCDEFDLNYGPILRKQTNDSFKKNCQKKLAIQEKVSKQLTDSFKLRQCLNKIYDIRNILEGKLMQKHFIMNTINYYRVYHVDEEVRPTIIVSPGGGYKYTSLRESEPVVEAFNNLGYHVCVINYRETKEDAYPFPGEYLAWAIDKISEDKRIGKLIGLGFSAGGHCLLEVILHHADYNLKAKFSLLMLGYPVITANSKYAHFGSYHELLRYKDTDELMKYLSLETQVTKDNAVDLFLWGTFTDESVSVMNSLLLVEAYQKVNANVEYHLFPLGAHGLSVATKASADGDASKDIPYIARWVNLADEWIKLKLGN